MRTGDAAEQRRYDRDSLEFGRVVNLSDAIFGIAMTLLVFTLSDAAVSLDRVDAAITDQRGELIAFVISFALIANFWWIHHQLFSRLKSVEPVVLALNIALLGAVALVPYPTGLLGQDPTSSAAVVPYLGLINLISLLHLAMLARARAAGLWLQPMPRHVYPWVLGVWGTSAAVTMSGFVVAFVWPVAGLVLALCGWPVTRQVERRAPSDYAQWA